MKTSATGITAPLLLAGWLFADLLLAFTIIMLGAQAPPPRLAGASPGPTGNVSPSPTPPPAPPG